MTPVQLRNRFRMMTGAALIAACHPAAAPEGGSVKPELQPLSGMVSQPLIIAPVQSVRVAPELAWTGLPASASITASLDSAIVRSLRDRVANSQWVYFDALAQSFANNVTYATDPRSLAVAPLRTPRWKIGDRLPEPLASQLRTMIALQDARLVLLPVELRFDRTSAGLSRPVVHLVLVDPRVSTIRWFGDIAGTDSPTFNSAYSATLADRIADLFVGK